MLFYLLCGKKTIIFFWSVVAAVTNVKKRLRNDRIRKYFPPLHFVHRKHSLAGIEYSFLFFKYTVLIIIQIHITHFSFTSSIRNSYSRIFLTFSVDLKIFAYFLILVHGSSNDILSQKFSSILYF